jgi:hypothetical protein
MAAKTPRLLLAALPLLAATLFVAAAARAHDGPHTTLEGEFEIIRFDDFENARSHERYFLNGKHGRSELVFGSAPRGLRTGQKIRVRGRAHGPRAFHADSVAALGGDAGSGSGGVAAAPQLRAAVVLMVNLSDASASSRYTLAQLASAMWTGARNVDALYQAGSYDQMAFPPDTNGDGSPDAYGPFDVNYSAASCDYSAWASAADSQASAAGVNLSLYRHRVYVLPRYNELSCGWAGLANVGCGTYCRAWIAEGESPMVYAHELGHNVGQAHAGTDPENDGVVNQEYGDLSDPMGISRAWHVFNAPHVDQMRWFDAYPGTIATVTANGVYDLRPLGVHPLTTGGLRALRIAKPDTGGYYYLSFRQALGYDDSLASTYTQGVNIHRYAGSGYALTSFIDSLATGESFQDTANGLTVTQLGRASDGSYATVQVAFGCAERAPTVTVAPASQAGLPGASLAYSVTVTNRDGAGCDPASFALGASFPSGLAGSFGSASLALAPGASGSTNLAVTTPLADGSRSFTVQAAGPGGSASATASALTDGTAPSAPAGLTAAIQKKTQVKLAWTASSDAGGTGVASYRIHREGGSGPRDFTSSSASYVDTQATSGATYIYTVRAADALGNLSAASNAATIAVGGSTGGGGGGGGGGKGRR